jgi:hypothetical protein
MGPNGDGSKNLRLVVPNPAKRPEPLPPNPTGHSTPGAGGKKRMASMNNA